MSGSGPDYTVGDGVGGGDGDNSCTTLRFKTTLNSPVASVIASLSSYDSLLLQYTDEHSPVVAIAPNGKVAGSITGLKLLQLIKCMEKSFEYEAIVLRVTGGNVEVEVRLKV